MRTRANAVALAFLLVGSSERAALAADPPSEEEARDTFLSERFAPWPAKTVRVAFGGYLLPQFELVSLPNALPRDQLVYGARGTRAGFFVHGTPYDQFSYVAHVVVLPAGTENLAVLEPTTNTPVATTGPLAALTATGTSIQVEELSVGYRPVKWYEAKLGFVRIPFSLAQTTPIPKQMLPIRPAPTTAFQSGADAGLLNTFSAFDQRVLVNLGAYSGTSLGTFNPRQTVRGLVFGGSLEVHPLGLMALREGDMGRGPPRFSLGVGALYRSATAFDATGYEATSFKDTRVAASARAGWQGAYVQGEVLRRVQTDDLSGRPIAATGAYVAGSYYAALGAVAFGPIVRVGTLSVDQDFAPRKFTSFEGGVAFYPRADLPEPERLRIIAEYLTANVKPQDESERELLVQLQVQW